MTSNVHRSTFLVRIRFQDGRLGVFHNDLHDDGCCYDFGVRYYNDPSLTSIRRQLLAYYDDEDCGSLSLPTNVQPTAAHLYCGCGRAQLHKLGREARATDYIAAIRNTFEKVGLYY